MFKKILTVLIVTVFVAGVSAPVIAQTSKTASSQEQPQGPFTELAPEAAATLIQQQQEPNFVILDVRTPEEFATGHLEHAINIDYSAPTFRALLTILNPQKTYLVYCHSGRRSGDTFQMMQALHFSRAYNLTGGIAAWTAKHLSVVK